MFNEDNKDQRDGKQRGLQVVEVHCGPLKDYLHTLKIKHIHFFSLDVEGAELLVVQQFDFAEVTVDVMIVEAINSYNTADNEKNTAVRKIMKAAGFTLHPKVIHKSDLYIRNGFEQGSKSLENST